MRGFQYLIEPILDVREELDDRWYDIGWFEKDLTTNHGAISGLMMKLDATSITRLGAKDKVNLHTNLRSSFPNTRFVQKICFDNKSRRHFWVDDEVGCYKD